MHRVVSLSVSVVLVGAACEDASVDGGGSGAVDAGKPEPEPESPSNPICPLTSDAGVTLSEPPCWSADAYAERCTCGFCDVDCEDPQPIDAQAGVERCADRGLVRKEAPTCVLPEPTDGCELLDGVDECATDAECTARANGVCRSSHGVFSTDGEPWCVCQYGCASDADCADDEACLCGRDSATFDTPGALRTGPISRCVPAECRTGADCASGECGVFEFHGQVEFACRRPNDGCRSREDCTMCSGRGFEVCVPDANGAYCENDWIH